jgi:carbon monoxide dehydrogenase subunit G
MKNGDKIFSELTAVVVPNSTTGRTDGTFGGKIIRGTGKFAGIAGLMRGTNSFDLKGYNEGSTDVDYSLSE